MCFVRISEQTAIISLYNEALEGSGDFKMEDMTSRGEGG